MTGVLFVTNLQLDLLAAKRVQSPIAIIRIVHTAIRSGLITASIGIRIILLIGSPVMKSK
jgi:hypothetical protein